MMHLATVPMAVTTGVVVIVIAVAIVLVVLIVALSMRDRQKRAAAMRDAERQERAGAAGLAHLPDSPAQLPNSDPDLTTEQAHERGE